MSKRLFLVVLLLAQRIVRWKKKERGAKRRNGLVLVSCKSTGNDQHCKYLDVQLTAFTCSAAWLQTGCGIVRLTIVGWHNQHLRAPRSNHHHRLLMVADKFYEKLTRPTTRQWRASAQDNHACQTRFLKICSSLIRCVLE